MELLITIGVVWFLVYAWGILYGSKKPNNQQNAQHQYEPFVQRKLNVEQIDVEEIKLSEEQSKILSLLENTRDIYYITGKAGTGKSVLLRYFVANTTKQVVVLAPTGVAALNVGGQTIHSFFKIPFDLDLHNISLDPKTRELLRNIDVVVIDEVSMVRVDLMEAISIKLQKACGNDLPFGGVQMIMFGDLYQLPPVVTDGELERYFNHNFGGHYFFNSTSIKKSNMKTCELEHIFRQKDPVFKEILNSIRVGNTSESILSALNERVVENGYIGNSVTLAGTNATVSSINSKKLAQLDGEESIYEAKIWGNIQESSFPTEKHLKLKVGAQVMLLKNDTEKPRRWVNGTVGVISKLSKDVIKVNIDGVDHTIIPASWDKIRYEYDTETRVLKKKVISSFSQFPLKLAWAITIHKSQGKTYQSVLIDLSGGAFAHGQTYVALSRCVSLDGLYLNSPIKHEDIIVDPDIIEFMKGAIIMYPVAKPEIEVNNPTDKLNTQEGSHPLRQKTSRLSKHEKNRLEFFCHNPKGYEFKSIKNQEKIEFLKSISDRMSYQELERFEKSLNLIDK